MAQLYKVDATETVRRSFFIRAESKEEAEEGAEALSSLVPSDDTDDDYWVRPFAGDPPDGAWVWSGGEKGDWE